MILMLDDVHVTKGVTCGQGTANPSGASGLTPDS